MDREGIAAEMVYHGFFRVADLGFSVMNAIYPPEIVDAGVRAYHRWVFDVFGSSADRFLLVGAIGACTDLDATYGGRDGWPTMVLSACTCPDSVRFRDSRPLTTDYWDPAVGTMR